MKDLTEYLSPGLKIPVGGKEYVVPDPSYEDGLRLAALVTFGLRSMGDPEAEIDEDTVGKLRGVKDVQRLALGPVLDDMIADGRTGKEIALAGQYAMYAHVLGELAAQAMFETLHGTPEEQVDEDPKASSPRGRRTGSASPTRTASTRGTAASPSSSARAAKTRRTPASR
ncbi:hypothetical protein CWIS_13570 [Cellulomonas sp. A375-1]|uniref:DUF7426 family protein n=1 Tax=Cellulomonas sp. A375-1 TaxID=1672219 RepID=UPI00065273D5|nr:hypothetical protein [Cellulomonas sp. A375-1]KMM44858.1 hypothetical protein CWIS_13570 [Cellulomonas sp. A375-1]